MVTTQHAQFLPTGHTLVPIVSVIQRALIVISVLMSTIAPP
ncbi:hypothetical protein MAR_015457 [Mya arenaria]|uniref:Uncharacterized protein n=1 Tax=Mya arenaria TaxID=6604 RepID=A0ABY7FH30_MYAAR|nr:hypothetical protein MAR_015457 [Mya arenaria]